jgi:pimeloyl-ACP methyl ester carboxylesterase
LAVLLYFYADHLILFPSRHPIPTGGETRLTTLGPKGTVEIWSLRSDACKGREPAAMVLHFVGNASRAEAEGRYVVDQWRDWPVEVWAVNYPGYGDSDGSAKLASIPPAALAAYDAIKSHANGRPIFISGRSIGTTAALYVAAHRPCSGVILHSPPPLRRLILGHHGWWNGWLAAVPVALRVPGDLDSLQNAEQVHAPAILIQSGSADNVVPPKYQQMVFDAYAGPKEFVRMPLAGHGSPVNGESRKQFKECVDRMWAVAISAAHR